jgi:hypothetical protein
VHQVKRDSGDVIFNFLTEGIRESRESSHPHSHRETRTLDIAGKM